MVLTIYPYSLFAMNVTLHSATVMTFDYNKLHINILDTPGHQDFSEDTYR